MRQQNPFVFGSPVRGADFLDRRRELRRLAGRILKGSSALITAEPRFGKTSLLLRLQEADLYGDEAERLHFCFLDAQTMAGWDVPCFWEHALRPIRSLTPALQEAYQAAEHEHFGAFGLERILYCLEKAGERLVLLLDEFDVVLDISGLNTAEFYGGLRSLASRFSSLALVIASRQSVVALNNATRSFSRLGSPYFNFVGEVSLGPLPRRDADALLDRAGEVFDNDDRRFLTYVSGRHPYFLQATAYYLWEARQEGIERGDGRVWAGERCFHQAASVLEDTWRVWTPYQQMAFVLAALDALPSLLPGRRFDVAHLLKDRPDLVPEQRGLKERGFLRPADLPGGYEPQAQVMFWFLAEKLATLLRPRNPDVAAWLRDQQWEGILKHGEKEELKEAFKASAQFFGRGVEAFIKSAAEGLGKGIAPP